DVPVTIKSVPQEEFSSRAWVVEKLRTALRKAPNSIDKMSTFGVLRLRATKLYHAINL
ncbi:MAG: hypothetical protein QOE55_2198, partial [Acidobacteriaceae bacterium]|nr:hypothetical protein [Acidobacteriaceae bacterium]